VEPLPVGEKIAVTAESGTIALDGEREIEFARGEHPFVWLDRRGPLTVDVNKTLELAANQGLLVSRTRNRDLQKIQNS
jgi:hypothetical protein